MAEIELRVQVGGPRVLRHRAVVYAPDDSTVSFLRQVGVGSHVAIHSGLSIIKGSAVCACCVLWADFPKRNRCLTAGSNVSSSRASTMLLLHSDTMRALGVAVGEKVIVKQLAQKTIPAAVTVHYTVSPNIRLNESSAAYCDLESVVASILIDSQVVYKGQVISTTVYQMPVVVQVDKITSVAETSSSFALVDQTETRFRLTLATQQKTNEKSQLYDSYCGYDGLVSKLKDKINSALFMTHEYTSLNLLPPRGALIYGPSGTGKTRLLYHLKAFFAHIHVELVAPSALDLQSESVVEATLTRIFKEANEKSPSLLLIDELDVLCPQRSNQVSDSESRIVSCLLSLIDGPVKLSKVFIVAATNKVHNVDQALRRPGRFDSEFEMEVPTKEGRAEIFASMLEKITHGISKMEIINVATTTMHGFVAADISMVTRKAATSAVIRASKAKTDQVELTLQDLKDAVKSTKPSSLRENQVTVPNVKWEDIGGNDNIKQALKECVEWPLRRAHDFIRFGISPPKGLLMYGPPGCSKTLVAKALATECSFNFLAVKGPELFSKWVGDSEKAIRSVFQKARAASPSIIFFDEIDAIAGKRNNTQQGGGGVTERVLAQLLNEMDGVEPLVNVFVVAATNRPDLIDEAIMRPGRIDRILYVGPPTKESILGILKINAKRYPCHPDINWGALSERLCGCSGAEVVQCFQEAAFRALDTRTDATELIQSDFDFAVTAVPRRITKEMIQFYETYKQKGKV